MDTWNTIQQLRFKLAKYPDDVLAKIGSVLVNDTSGSECIEYQILIGGTWQSAEMIELIILQEIAKRFCSDRKGGL